MGLKRTQFHPQLRLGRPANQSRRPSPSACSHRAAARADHRKPVRLAMRAAVGPPSLPPVDVGGCGRQGRLRVTPAWAAVYTDGAHGALDADRRQPDPVQVLACGAQAPEPPLLCRAWRRQWRPCAGHGGGGSGAPGATASRCGCLRGRGAGAFGGLTRVRRRGLRLGPPRPDSVPSVPDP